MLLWQPLNFDAPTKRPEHLKAHNTVFGWVGDDESGPADTKDDVDLECDVATHQPSGNHL